MVFSLQRTKSFWSWNKKNVDSWSRSLKFEFRFHSAGGYDLQVVKVHMAAEDSDRDHADAEIDGNQRSRRHVCFPQVCGTGTRISDSGSTIWNFLAPAIQTCWDSGSTARLFSLRLNEAASAALSTLLIIIILRFFFSAKKKTRTLVRTSGAVTWFPVSIADWLECASAKCVDSSSLPISDTEKKAKVNKSSCCSGDNFVYLPTFRPTPRLFKQVCTGQWKKKVNEI